MCDGDNNTYPRHCSPTIAKSVVCAANLTSTVLFVVGVALLGIGIPQILEEKPNLCQMTYMYQGYAPVFLSKQIRAKFPKRYSVHLYREQSVDEAQISANDIPVFFIPGHGGDYRQVRSIASVSARQHMNQRWRFAFYTFDFDGELSGLSGSSIQLQTAFVHEAASEVLAKSKHDQGIIIAHSMGGIVARLLARDAGMRGKFPLLLTLATPHLFPLAMLDEEMNKIYRSIQQDCIDYTNKTTLVSIGGGHRDLMINAASVLISDHGSPNYFDTVSVESSAIPSVGIESDHFAILWCNQIVKTVSALIDELVDPSTRKVLAGPNERRVIVEQALLPTFKNTIMHRMGPVRYFSIFPCYTLLISPLESTRSYNGQDIDILQHSIGLPYSYKGEWAYHVFGNVTCKRSRAIRVRLFLHSASTINDAILVSFNGVGKERRVALINTHFSPIFPGIGGMNFSMSVPKDCQVELEVSPDISLSVFRGLLAHRSGIVKIIVVISFFCYAMVLLYSVNVGFGCILYDAPITVTQVPILLTFVSCFIGTSFFDGDERIFNIASSARDSNFCLLAVSAAVWIMIACVVRIIVKVLSFLQQHIRRFTILVSYALSSVSVVGLLLSMYWIQVSITCSLAACILGVAAKGAGNPHKINARQCSAVWLSLLAILSQFDSVPYDIMTLFEVFGSSEAIDALAGGKFNSTGLCILIFVACETGIVPGVSFQNRLIALSYAFVGSGICTATSVALSFTESQEEVFSSATKVVAVLGLVRTMCLLSNRGNV